MKRKTPRAKARGVLLVGEGVIRRHLPQSGKVGKFFLAVSTTAILPVGKIRKLDRAEQTKQKATPKGVAFCLELLTRYNRSAIVPKIAVGN